jgi:hypothetical protein
MVGMGADGPGGSVSINIDWMAIEGGEPAVLLEALGLREIEASPHPTGARYAYTITPKGWLLLVGRSLKLDVPQLAPHLSAETQVLSSEVSDVVMCCRLEAWRAGTRLWSVSHDPEEGVDNLEVAGEPPAALGEIAARLNANQAAETESVDHLFDAPLELGAAICGYRPDEPQPGPWILLEAVGKRPVGPKFSALPAAIRAELLPALAEQGWTLAPVRLTNGFVYDASRVQDGRLEASRFLWRDDRGELEVFRGFACLEGESADGRVVGAASAGTDKPRPTLGQRLKALLPGQRPKPYEQLVREAVDLARAELAEWDEIIAGYARDGGEG